ncbi:MAG: aldo/keto reductase family protein [Mycoplasmoidaceae bacterium]
MKSIIEAKIGFGTYLIKDQVEINLAIEKAIKSGYDFIDTASIYNNEQQIGKALKLFKKKNPNISLIPIQTKIWTTDFQNNISRKLKQSLKKLNRIKQVDSCLLHRPHIDNSVNVTAWKGLIKAQQSGLVKYIGVSNFDPDMIRILMNETGVCPQIVQDEANANYVRHDRITFAKKYKINAQAWRPLGLIKENLKDEFLNSLAAKYDCSVVNILINYVIKLGYVPIVKSVDQKRIELNISKLDIDLSIEECQKIDILLNKHETTSSSKTDSYAFHSIKMINPK